MAGGFDTAVWQQRAQDARTAAWLYPIKGIYYFATNRFLWPLMRARLIPCILLSAFILATLFFWTYLPQVAFLKIINHGRSSWFSGAVLVLGEGAAITALLFEAFLVDETLVDIFDAVLVREGHEELVSTMRPVERGAGDPYKRLGRPQYPSTYSPFSFRQIIEFVVLLPLNFVPWIGVPVFLWLTGYRAGPLQHWRYFKLKEYGKQERDAFVKSRRLQYTSFGCMALVLQLVPGLSMLFLMTTATGSALWAVKIEDQHRSPSPHDQDGAESGQPPSYTEYADEEA